MFNNIANIFNDPWQGQNPYGNNDSDSQQSYGYQPATYGGPADSGYGAHQGYQYSQDDYSSTAGSSYSYPEVSESRSYSQPSRSIAPNLSHHIAEGDFKGVANDIKSVIQQYLPSDKDFKTPSIRFVSIPNRSEKNGMVGTVFGQQSNGEIRVNSEPFHAASKSGKIPPSDIMHGMCIIIAHEMTHAWQEKHAFFADMPHKEGHATWIQNKFSEDMGFQHLNDRLAALHASGPQHIKSLYLDMSNYFSNIEKNQGIDAAHRAIIKNSEENKSSFYTGGSSNTASARSSGDMEQLRQSESRKKKHWYNKLKF